MTNQFTVYQNFIDLLLKAADETNEYVDDFDILDYPTCLNDSARVFNILQNDQLRAFQELVDFVHTQYAELCQSFSEQKSSLAKKSTSANEA